MGASLVAEEGKIWQIFGNMHGINKRGLAFALAVKDLRFKHGG